MADDTRNILDEVTGKEYKYGFVTEIDTEFAPPGLNEDIIRFISEKKEEPEFMLEFRLNAYRRWLGMKSPEWAHLNIPPIDFQSIIYYAAP
nr:Fe-S cluster assembly protein SufB [Bacteroidales bacterium]